MIMSIPAQRTIKAAHLLSFIDVGTAVVLPH
jgi:hypothetical protein